MNHYQRLGVDQAASADDIRKAFRSLSKTHHPDAGGDENEYKLISEAYQVLKDPVRRSNYDAEQLGSRSFHSADPQGWDGFSDILNALRRAQAKQQRDLFLNLVLTPAETYNGVTNKVIRTRRGTFTVNIPQGVRAGTTLTFDGIVSSKSGAGDLTVQISIAEQNDWQIRGDDIFHLIDVDAIDAITGVTAEFVHLDGVTRQIKIPPGSQHGLRLRFAGYGLNRPSENVKGDLYVVINIVVPTLSNPEIIKTLKNINRS